MPRENITLDLGSRGAAGDGQVTTPFSPPIQLPFAPRAADLLEIGSCVDETYEIVRKIASGGMGQVFEGFDRRLSRPVAIKVAWPRLTSGMSLEAKTLAGLRHEGILAVHYLGFYRGLDYMVTELLSGESLERQLARSGPLPVAECLDLLDRIADALGHLHKHGLVHRDLKPANVMLSPIDRVVLVDLGIAVSDGSARDPELAGGTPPYMAPEAFTATVRPGEAHLLDIYALGVLAFELVTGVLPFADGSPQEIAQQHLEVIPPRPSVFRERLPPRLDHLIAALLAKSPGDRPASISSVRAQLRAVRRSMESFRASQPPGAVLIVDDDVHMLALLRACVEQAAPGVRVEVATTGTSALERIATGSFDLVLLDLELPDVSGLEVFLQIATVSQASTPRVAVVSLHDDEGSRMMMRRLGVHGFVSKRHGVLEMEDAVADLVLQRRPRARDGAPMRLK